MSTLSGPVSLVAQGVLLRHNDLLQALDVPHKDTRDIASFVLTEQDERGPDEEFRLRFEASPQFDKDEKKAARTLLDTPILEHQARR